LKHVSIVTCDFKCVDNYCEIAF